MKEKLNNISRPGKFLAIVCCTFLFFLSSPSVSDPSQLTLVQSTTIKNLLLSSHIMLAQESLPALTMPDISATKKINLIVPKAGNTTNKNLVCFSIIGACFFLFSLMLFWISRTKKKYLILKIQNEELIYQSFNIQKNNEADNKCLFKANNSSPFKLVDSIFVKTHERMVKIPLKDILYIQADRNYCCLCTKEKEYLVVMPLKEFYQKLSSTQFLRIHRSYVINLSHIQEIGTGHVVIERKSLPLSKSSKEELLKHLQTI